MANITISTKNPIVQFRMEERETIPERILPPEAQALKKHSHKLGHQIKVLEIIPLLDEKELISEVKKQRIKAVQTLDGDILASNELIDDLVRKDNFFEPFIEILRHEDVKLSALADILEEELANVKAEREERKQKIASENQRRLALDIGENCAKVESNDILPNTTNGGKGTMLAEPKIIPLSVVEPRKYQNVLARPGIQGKNAIICAPTGSGKTLVASLIIRAHLSRNMPNEDEGMTDKRPKVLYLVPRFTILHHIFKEFEKYLGTLYTIGNIHGGISDPQLALMWVEHDIVVATAAMFKNALDNNEMDICDISLLLFDECHYTMEKHPYNQIMYEYLKRKTNGSVGDKELPQIIGLTASPGAGGSLKLEGALSHILTLCGNLDAEAFQTVPEEMEDELKEFMHHPSKNKYVVYPNMRNKFILIIEGCMKKIEDKIALRHSYMRGSQQYESLLAETKRNAETGEADDDAIICCKHLMLYNNVLRLAHIAVEEFTYSLLKGEYDELSKRQSLILPIETYLLKIYTANREQVETVVKDLANNESLAQLKKVLLEHDEDMKEKGKKLRGMVFVRTIELAYNLKKWMMEREPDLLPYSCEVIIGSGGSQGEKQAMTKQQQLRIMDNFNTGVHSILICTSIASEGVDIQDCNLTVKYHHVTDEINMIQSRGRARAEDSKEVVIGMRETTAKDQVNEAVEREMKSAIARLKEMENVEFRRKINDEQQSIMREWQQQEKKKRRLQSLNNSSDIEFLCPGCPDGENFVCCASDVRTLRAGSSYVVPDETFTDKINIEENERDEIQRIYCAKCKTHWGIIDSTFPCLGIRYFNIKIRGQRHPKIKKWKQIPCYIEPYC